MKKRTFIFLVVVIAAALLIWVSCSTTEPGEQGEEGAEASGIAVISDKWVGSAHAQYDSEAFAHWNESDPAEVPPACADCHSTSGFRDYIGADGTAAGTVENAGRIEDPINCTACHGATAAALDSVTMPSGITLANTGSSSVCMHCHGARTSQATVDQGIPAGADLDTVLEKGAAVNPHYAIAAATQQGSAANGGYEYEGKTYVGAFEHAESVNSCTECHDPHSTHLVEVSRADANLCVECHSEATSFENFRSISRSKVDYDGNGTAEPIYNEIQGMYAILTQAIEGYSKAVTGNALALGTVYPYTYIDKNGDFVIDESEAVSDNGFTTFTPRLQKAIYNQMFVLHDSANYVHNGKYVLQLMYDSIEDLSAKSGITTQGMTRP